MADPVLCADGRTYERVAMAARLAAGNCISPVTEQPLPQRQLTKKPCAAQYDPGGGGGGAMRQYYLPRAFVR